MGKECLIREGNTSANYRRVVPLISEFQSLLGGVSLTDCSDILVAIVEHLAPEIPDVVRMQQFFSIDSWGKDTRQEVKQFAEEIYAIKPLRGLKVLEIGGPFAQMLHGLGAEATCVDPDIKGWSRWDRSSYWNYTPLQNPELYHPIAVRLTESNWTQHLTPETFDISFSHWVLSRGSGTSSDWRNKLEDIKSENYRSWDDYDRQQSALFKENDLADQVARRMLFEVSARVTCPQGLILHQGGAVCDLDNITDIKLNLLEWRRSLLGNMDGEPLFVFRKTG